MGTTVKKANICLTKEMERQLKELMELYGENVTTVLSRALDTLYRLKFGKFDLNS